MTKWVNVSIPKELIVEVDNYIKEKKGYVSRAEVIRAALRIYLGQN